MLKRFMVFTGHKDQCQSGWDSIDSSFDTKEKAIARASKLTGYDPNKTKDDEDNDDGEGRGSLWCQVIDSSDGTTVLECGYEVP